LTHDHAGVHLDQNHSCPACAEGPANLGEQLAELSSELDRIYGRVPVTTGREDGAAGARGQLRTSDADRERAIDVLKAAFVQGLLNKDEFSLRVGQVIAS
jgi:hypothetical protein